uniref:Uncharacterized protein n=1 Tax=Euplotes harpa TaxID=151035 RepID=A0A7S3JAR3_9SPIT|mmetsp:Transcript_29550/g.33871  ORF Transcript_29550/g.33871 Transcript_29550/m.33871 type:complete len:132 (+) Transcript_29550:273-668(+)
MSKRNNKQILEKSNYINAHMSLKTNEIPVGSLHFHKRSQSTTSKPMPLRSRIGQSGRIMEKSSFINHETNLTYHHIRASADLQNRYVESKHTPSQFRPLKVEFQDILNMDSPMGTNSSANFKPSNKRLPWF